MKKQAICIKSYQDEDDVDRFKNGEISEEEIHTYQVGDKDEVNPEYYDPKSWKIVG